MAYLAVNRNGEELVFNDCPIYDRVEDTWKIPMLRWELVYWYRAAVEFQSMQERERLAFCSWCCCHGGCNLCADISKYNIKGLKIYGG